MKDIFPINRNPYILRQNYQFSRPRINTVYQGTKSVFSLWYLVPSNLKEIPKLDKFKTGIKQWKSEDFPCRLCKVFVEYVIFLEK